MRKKKGEGNYYNFINILNFTTITKIIKLRDFYIAKF